MVKVAVIQLLTLRRCKIFWLILSSIDPRSDNFWTNPWIDRKEPLPVDIKLNQTA